MIKAIKAKLMREFLSRKFLCWVVACVFFALGTLSENGFLIISGAYMGFNFASALIKGRKENDIQN